MWQTTHLAISCIMLNVFCCLGVHEHACGNEYTIILSGCWKDEYNKVIPTIDTSSNSIGNCSESANARCACACAARQKGYTVFFLQNEGECSSFANAGILISLYAERTECDNDDEGGLNVIKVYELKIPESILATTSSTDTTISTHSEGSTATKNIASVQSTTAIGTLATTADSGMHVSPGTVHRSSTSEIFATSTGDQSSGSIKTFSTPFRTIGISTTSSNFKSTMSNNSTTVTKTTVQSKSSSPHTTSFSCAQQRSSQTKLTEKIDIKPQSSRTLNVSSGETTILGFSTKTNEAVTIDVTILTSKSCDLNELVQEETVLSSKQTAKVKKRVLLQPLIDFRLSKVLKEVNVNYSIQISSSTLNVTEITSSATYGKSGVVTIEHAEPQCVYLDEKRQKFSTFGIVTIRNSDGSFVCSSNHTTIFSSLLSLTVVVIPDQAKILTYVMESISVISLGMTIAILLRLKNKLRNDRVFVQINLSLAMACFHLSALLHDVVITNSRACEFIAISLQYFMLASAFWMLLEGVTLVTKTLDSALNHGSSKRTNTLRFLVGWGIPAVIVMITATSGFLTKSYMSKTPDSISHLPGINKYQQCWLDKRNKGVLIGGLLVPVITIIFLNLLILMKVGIFVFRMSKQTDKYKPNANNAQGQRTFVDGDMQHVRTSLRAACLLLPVLGIPWCLLLLSERDASFMYLNIIVNGLQGFFIFIIYCPLSKEVRRSAVRIWNQSNFCGKFPLPTTTISNVSNSTTASSL